MKKELSWYKGKCESARVEFYKAAQDKKPKSTKDISDAGHMQQITRLLDKLPVSGQEMIKMGPTAPHIKLILKCDGSNYEVHFYNNRIQTPATSYYSSEAPEEKALLQLLKGT